MSVAVAEESATTQDVVAIPVPIKATSTAGAKLQRAVVNVGDKSAMDAELKFWTEACQMKVLSDKVGSDGLRSVVVGYAGVDRFGIDIKQDPAVLKRPKPKTLNYEVMQPFVNALNFIQVSQRGKIMECFKKVQESGGVSVFGDASYLDAESPRGVQVRIVPRKTEPSVDLVSLNIEVPAFAPVVKFYERGIGLQRLEYDPEGPPVQKYSILMGSSAGGPNLLLTPVPDGRLKDKRLDEFEGILMIATSVKQVADDAAVAVQAAAREAEEKEEQIKRRLEVGGAAAPKVKKGTKAVPSVSSMGEAIQINDGVSNIIMVTDNIEATAVFA